MHMRQLLIYGLTTVLCGIPLLASAQIPTIVTCNGALPGNGLPACGVCDLAKLAQNVLNAGIYIAVFLSALLFAYAGFLYLTNEAIGQQQRAKSMFQDVVFGLVIILGAWLVVDTLMKTLVGGQYLPWNRICG